MAALSRRRSIASFLVKTAGGGCSERSSSSACTAEVSAAVAGAARSPALCSTQMGAASRLVTNSASTRNGLVNQALFGKGAPCPVGEGRSEEHTSELQSHSDL